MVQNCGEMQVVMVSVLQLVSVCVMVAEPAPVQDQASVQETETVAVVSEPPPTLVSVHAVVPPSPVQLAE